MLGIYSFNNILFYLKECNYEKIYDRDDLIILPDNHVRHSKYNFIFKHDYKIENSQINNYDFIRDRFDLKIKNFLEMLSGDNMCIFIVFTKNLDNLKIDEMLDWLFLKKNINFHLMIFTSNKHKTTNQSQMCSIINLKIDYNRWFVMDNITKKTLYEEIYEEFINCLNKQKYNIISQLK